ncbi:acyl-CoA dehydrogenase family protein [Mycobacterium yunnanensis]|uniref:Acyl-CoA dehydrogenase family protein n=1 Tax=Mycobacterium yunnanensis TaxID=368477 RepID=A0A9X2Z7X1_9MYCO|nr:acyl-CoA dehydrogenase family protein [Mycobacterium yunnanensis]MCV7423107.1 acyl-CoA dehydrogenase family protein [Mycobacterium yunnanensis]
MDFSRIPLSDDDQAFLERVRSSLRTCVTDEVIRRDRDTGENFDEAVHVALGELGFLAGDFLPESEGGFSPVQRRIWELEIGRARTPWFHWGTTAMVARIVLSTGSTELIEEVLPGVLSGHVRICLGFTEPDGGSDVATCKTRAVRNGDDWIVDGSKMYTSNAQHSRYVFLLTNTDPTAPKHCNLTMFLVPLDTEGIEIHGIRTVDGDRTNIVFYDGVRVADGYRIGDIDGGWSVMREALKVEHGIQDRDTLGLQSLSTMSHHGALMAQAVDGVGAVIGDVGTGGRRLVDDGSVGFRFGRLVARMEAALSTPGMFGRVALAQTMRDIAPELMDVVGIASSLPVDADGSVGGGAAEHLFRLAVPTGIYGGTLEVFRNMIAQNVLGLGRPSYSVVT